MLHLLRDTLAICFGKAQLELFHTLIIPLIPGFERPTVNQVRKFGVSSSMLHRWRKEFQANATNVFQDKRDPKQKARSQGYEPGQSPDDLKKIIGELTVQNEILKKASGLLRK